MFVIYLSIRPIRNSARFNIIIGITIAVVMSNMINVDIVKPFKYFIIASNRERWHFFLHER